MDFIAKTMHGLEDLLVEELKSIGAKKVLPLRRAVGFSGDLEVLYKANYTCRYAIRILKQQFHFEAQNEQELYDKVHEIAWEKLMGLDETFAIDASVNSTLFKHSKYASLKMKDAIADRFRRHYAKRPNVDPANPDLGLHLHIYEDKVSISIDSSGDSLHKRGYRSSGHAAPLNEILAAGLVKLSGWTKDEPLLDPMCGSGTIPIEAAMLASNTPAGLIRQHYAFMNWKDFDLELWEKVKEEENKKIDSSGISIKASDLSGIHVRLARTAAEAIGLADCIEFQKEDFFELDGDSGYILMNPPYGERMDQMDIETFYEELADHLKRNFPGTQCWLISSNNEALLRFGLKPSKRIVLYNGPLQCLFQQFVLYKGSKKAKYQDGHIDRAIREHGEGRESRTDGKRSYTDRRRSDDKREGDQKSQRKPYNDRPRGPRSDREKRNDNDRERKPWRSEERSKGSERRSSSRSRNSDSGPTRQSGKIKWSREKDTGDSDTSFRKPKGPRDKFENRTPKKPHRKGQGFKKKDSDKGDSKKDQ
jgi:putative N6-adenine-specific DNA methylase